MAGEDYIIYGKTVEVHDLSFLSERNHHYGWFRRHYRHHRLRLALKKAGKIIASSPEAARDLRRYYFISKERISLR